MLHSLTSLKNRESEWGMDFTMAPIEKLQPAFDLMVSATWIGATNTLRHFRQYAQWRKKHGLPCKDAVFNLRINQTIAIRDSMVSSPEQLAILLNTVFDPPSMHTIDIIYRVFLWMGFSGLQDRQAVNVISDEIDLERMVIETPAGEYSICDESIEDFGLACALHTFTQDGRVFQRAEGDRIMRGKRSNRKVNTNAMLIHTIRPTLTRKLASAAQDNQERQFPLHVGFDITYNKVFLSGVFYRLHERERLGKPLNFERYAQDAFERAQAGDKPYKVSVHNPKAAVLLRIKKSAATDYANWKRAFGLE